MKNQIFPHDDKNYKVFAFTDNELILSSKKHSSIESLLASVEKSGMLESIKTVPVAAISEIDYNEKDEYFTVKYDKNGKTKKQTVNISGDLRSELVNHISDMKSFSKNVNEESKTQPLLLNLLGVILIPVATYVFRGMAIDAQNGSHYEVSGRRSGLKQLFVDGVEALGPTGVTAIGTVGLAYMVYVTYKRYSQPASVVQYK